MGEPPCGAEPRIELGPALQQADALPAELRRTYFNWSKNPPKISTQIRKIISRISQSIQSFVAVQIKYKCWAKKDC